MTAPSPTWPEIAARLRDTVARCDRDTDLELSAGPRGIRLLVRRRVVRVICPGHDEARLAALGWHRPTGDEGWWYEAPRTPEQVEWLTALVTRTAAEVLTDEPGALSCRALPTAALPAPESRPDLGSSPGPLLPPAALPGPQARTAAARPAPSGATPAGAGPAGATPAGTAPDGAATDGGAEVAVVAVLAAAVQRRDLAGYLATLAAATVCIPLAGEPSPDADFPWSVLNDATGAPLLPVFTSPEALGAFTGDGVPFIALPCSELLEDWPAPSWGLAVDPGTPQALTLTASALAALLTANLPTL